MKRIKTKIISYLLTATLVITGLCLSPVGMIEVKAANTLPTTEFWVEPDEFKTGYDLNGGTIAKIKFGLDGSNARLWAICGVDTDGSLALLSTTEFAIAHYGDDSLYPYSNFVKDLDKYSDNDESTVSTYLSTTYLSQGEINKMNAVTVSTEHPEGGQLQVSDKKLYLPDATNGRNGKGVTTIRVGANNEIIIDITKLTNTNGFQQNDFWLRSPQKGKYGQSLRVSYINQNVSHQYSSVMGGDDTNLSVVPAFNLNLSDVSFASAADAASSTTITDGTLSTTANTFTLRYASLGSETATINADGDTVGITGATDDMYLVVQNDVGAYAKKLTSSTYYVSASEVTGIDDFNNCKVWLESTNGDRITTAKLATQTASSSTVTSVSVDPATVTVEKGETKSFSATVFGDNVPSQEVEWTVEDNNAGTTIDSDGILTVDLNETATTIKVRATSTQDSSKFGVATVTLTAPKFTVTVNNGSGSGDYAEGESVCIIADSAPSGKHFKEWTGADGLTFTSGSKTSSTATFTMPASAVTVTATYEDDSTPIPQYTVTVNNGSGSGDYAEGETVSITADTIAGKTFNKWESSDGVSFDNASSSTTTFAMPNKVVTVTATYKKSNNHSSFSDGNSDGGSSSSSSSSSSSPSVPSNELTGIYYNNRLNAMIVRTTQGPLCKLAFKNATPAGYTEAFSFNLMINHKATYDTKTGKFTLNIPTEYQKSGRTFALLGVDKTGKVTTFKDSDTSDKTITIDFRNFNGYAFSLIYTDGKATTFNTVFTVGSYKVSVDTLYIREKASTSSKKVGAYKRGASVTVTEIVTNTDGEIWGKTDKGYIALNRGSKGVNVTK